MSENELLLRVLRKVMLEKEFHFPCEEEENEDEVGRGQRQRPRDRIVQSVQVSVAKPRRRDWDDEEEFLGRIRDQENKVAKVNTDEYSSSRRREREG